MTNINKVWRITGPPENFITAITRGYWAVNEHNQNIWKNNLSEGDTVLFHSTGTSAYSQKVTSSIVGYAIVGCQKFIKKEYWWIQETNEGLNKWPFVFNLEEVYLFGDFEGNVDFSTPIQKKSRNKIMEEVELLSASGIALSKLNSLAKIINPRCPNFPVNGSISRINKTFEDLILAKKQKDLFNYSKGFEEGSKLEEKWGEICDEELQTESRADILAAAMAFRDDSQNQYATSDKPRRIRKENILQKRRVAFLEDHTCQICGFRCEYINSKGVTKWIIEVDHILDKAKGGGEEIGNLWVLCPNCHAKKTRGVIKIDPNEKSITENGSLINIRDNHLNW